MSNYACQISRIFRYSVLPKLQQNTSSVLNLQPKSNNLSSIREMSIRGKCILLCKDDICNSAKFHNFPYSFAVLSLLITQFITAKKRFYKDVSLVDAGNGSYEILLDSKKLKTPGGAIFSVESEPLALAVAHEWESQKDLVLLSQMHLTGIDELLIGDLTG